MVNPVNEEFIWHYPQKEIILSCIVGVASILSCIVGVENTLSCFAGVENKLSCIVGVENKSKVNLTWEHLKCSCLNLENLLVEKTWGQIVLILVTSEY